MIAEMGPITSPARATHQLRERVCSRRKGSSQGLFGRISYKGQIPAFWNASTPHQAVGERVFHAVSALVHFGGAAQPLRRVPEGTDAQPYILWLQKYTVRIRHLCAGPNAAANVHRWTS